MKLTEQQIKQLISNTHPSQDGQDLYGTCPQCGEDEFGISLTKDNHPFSCFRKAKCGFEGNIYTLLAYLGKTKDFTTKSVNDELSSFEEQKHLEVDLSLPQVQLPFGWKRVYDDEYLRTRHFTDEQFHKYKVGRSILKKDYVTVLVEMNGVVVAYLSRSVKSKEWIDKINEKRKINKEPKYRRYDNSVSDFSKMLFGYDEIVQGETTDIILVEGWLSKTKTDVNLDLDNGAWLKCVATFGAKVSEHQIELLKRKGIKRVYLWFEGDVIDKIKTIAGRLSSHFEVLVGYLPQGRDPNDFDQVEALGVMGNCVSPVEFSMNYI